MPALGHDSPTKKRVSPDRPTSCIWRGSLCKAVNNPTFPGVLKQRRQAPAPARGPNRGYKLPGLFHHHCADNLVLDRCPSYDWYLYPPPEEWRLGYRIVQSFQEGYTYLPSPQQLHTAFECFLPRFISSCSRIREFVLCFDIFYLPLWLKDPPVS